MQSTEVTAQGLIAAIQSISELLVDTEAFYQFEITGDDPYAFHLNIAKGEVSSGEGRVEDTDVQLTMDSKDFIGMLSGQLNGLKAICTKKLKIDGDLRHVMLLAQFIT